jgi:hypothetical protein
LPERVPSPFEYINKICSKKRKTGWYCTCKVGDIFVGCSAHISSVLWYLGYKKLQEKQSDSSFDFSKSLLNAGDDPESDSDCSSIMEE